MADIKELGESLLQRAENRNERNYKRSRREAYKVALATAGVGLMNNVLKQKADQFMQSEQVLAQKAKYRAAVAQADNIITTNDEIVKSGKTPEQYFVDTRYLPAMQEQFKAQFGEEVIPTTYMPQLLEQARTLASEEASRFSQALSAAQQIPDYETAISSIDSLVMPPRNVGSAFLEKVKGVFTGRSEKDFREQAVQQVRDRGLIKNETWNKLFMDISGEEGIDEAIRFVEQMDSRGFTKESKIERTSEVFKNDDGSYDVVHVTTVDNGTPTVSRDNMGARTRTDEVVEFADGVPYIVGTRTTQDSTEVVSVKSSAAAIDTAEGRASVAKALMSQNNPSARAQDDFTPDGYAEFNRRLAAIGTSSMEINTPEDFRKVADVYQNIAANKSYLKDPEGTSIRAEVFSTVLAEMTSLFSRMASDTVTPEELEELTGVIDRVIRMSGEAATGSPIIPPPANTTPAVPMNRSNVFSWDDQLP